MCWHKGISLCPFWAGNKPAVQISRCTCNKTFAVRIRCCRCNKRFVRRESVLDVSQSQDTDDRPHVFRPETDRKSTRLNSSHGYISYAVFCLKKKKHSTR